MGSGFSSSMSSISSSSDGSRKIQKENSNVPSINVVRSQTKPAEYNESNLIQSLIKPLNNR
jgi:hypothetical protein